ncbi:MAG TPA: ABC transporter permease [Anaerolineae bacterium]|nr:ABC transporter permease [Anaerolineae bacterium]
MLVFTLTIQPGWGAPQLTILAIAALPYAFAAAAQTMAVLVGGIDLSVAAMMTLTSVCAAVLMQGQSEEFGIIAVGLILLMGLGLGAINGLSIVLTRVPDIVVTLAFFFIWEGAALLVLDAPGGSSAVWLRDLIIGPVGGFILPAELGAWIPKALLLLAVSLGVVWIPLRRSRLGLSIYAVGSDRLAAFRSGVPVDRTKVAAYALTGLFAAMGGLVLTMNTGIGTPIQGPYLLASVAAVVLGGVSLAGGKGGLVGPIVAVFILRLARQDLTLMSIDPNVAQVVEGLIMVAVVLVGAVVALRSRRS